MELEHVQLRCDVAQRPAGLATSRETLDREITGRTASELLRGRVLDLTPSRGDDDVAQEVL